MYWLDNNTGISTAPTPPAVISLTKRFFTNGGLGEQPSIPEDFWFNMVQEELLGILTLAGITPDKSDLNQVAKAIKSIAFSAYPVGAPIPWPTAVPPVGFIAMTGQSFSAASYPKLALAYPSLTLPDMRRYVIRGWNNGVGLDPTRALLSIQTNQNKAHTHAPSVSDNFPGSGTIPYNPANTANGVFLRKTGNNYVDSSFSAASDGGSEARMDNIAFNYIVRAE